MRNVVLALATVALVGCDFVPGEKSKPVPDARTADTLPPSPRNTISILAWNVESGGADVEVVGNQLSGLYAHDINALSEVDPRSFELFARACDKGCQFVSSKTGNDDRLEIIYDTRRLELVRHQELDRYRDFELNNGNHRSPLLAHFRDRQSGIEFQVVVNHLARGKEEVRNMQAIGLREWARDQTLPTVTIGDFNLDFDFHTRRGNQAFIEILRDDVWSWVKPGAWIDTNWADPDHDGKDNFPGSMLDFAFVAGPAKDWKPACKVIVRDGDFPDDKTTSDHRPVELRLRP